MKAKILIFSIIIAIGMSACTVVNYQQNKPAYQETQLEVREFQTRMFDTNDTKLIMKALVNVLQDDNYIITNAVTDLGVLMAKKEIDLNSSRTQNTTSRDIDNQFWLEFFEAIAAQDNHRNKRTYNNQPQPYKKTKLVEVSINVTEYGKQSKVRANFQAKVLDNQGNVVEVYPLKDGKFYQDFFAKVDKSIYLQKNGL